jgi:hypothetical protein
LKGISFAESARFEEELNDFIMPTKTGLGVLSAQYPPRANRAILKVDGRAHQYQRCIIKRIPGIDIDPGSNSFLTAFQVANTTGITELLEFWAQIKRRVISENPVSNKLMFVFKLDFKLVFTKNHIED